MTLDPRQRERLIQLLNELRDDELSPQSTAELETIVARDASAMEEFLRTLNLQVGLRWLAEDQLDAVPKREAIEADEGTASSAAWLEAPSAASTEDAFGLINDAPIVVDILAAPSHASPFFSANMLYSYGVACLAVAIILISLYHVSYPVATTSVATDSAHAKPKSQFVGRITGLVECRWDDGNRTVLDAFVPVGQKFALTEGLVEITYNDGTKVLLQGPCQYTVDSPQSGYLRLGKLTAVVNKSIRHEAKQRRANAGEATVQRVPLFIVRTPTAIVSDLGTEFAVEVDKSGSSKAYVFRGEVEMRPSDTVQAEGPPLLLTANQSASVAVNANGLARAHRESNPSPVDGLARSLPKRVPIRLFNTGAGRKEGEPDRHWQIVAKSDERNFKPRPAIVTPIIMVRQSNGKLGRFQLPNNSKSAWISTDSRFSPPSKGATYTFRTTFDLTGALANTAILHGKFIADDRVTAIRLNGRTIDFPQLHGDLPHSFEEWAEFQVSDGFLPSVNVLEVDVWNTDAVQIKPSATALQLLDIMTCRVELSGSAMRDWRKDAGETEDHKGDY